MGRKWVKFWKFFEGFGVQYGPKIEENSLKMAVLAPRWAPLGDFWVILLHVGGKMATKSARMSQHRHQRPNPRGFERFTDGPDGREPAAGVGRVGFWLGGVARWVYFNVSSDIGVLENTKKDIGGSNTGGLKTEGSNRTLEAGRLDGSKTYKGNSSGVIPQPGGPGGRRIFKIIK